MLHFPTPEVYLPYRSVTINLVKYIDWSFTCPMLQLILIVRADLELRSMSERMTDESDDDVSVSDNGSVELDRLRRENAEFHAENKRLRSSLMQAHSWGKRS